MMEAAAVYDLLHAGSEAFLFISLGLAGVAPEDVYVVFNGRPLEESDLLSAAGVEEAATLNVLGRLLGGAKKRKKKTYTKPKKQKHKHKKIKLRVLKFYKVRPGGVCSSGHGCIQRRAGSGKQQQLLLLQVCSCENHSSSNSSCRRLHLRRPQQLLRRGSHFNAASSHRQHASAVWLAKSARLDGLAPQLRHAVVLQLSSRMYSITCAWLTP